MYPRYSICDRRASLLGMGLVLAAHGGLLLALMAQRADALPAPVERPILVSLILPATNTARSETPKAEPVIPPKPVRRVAKPQRRSQPPMPPVAIQPEPQLVAQTEESVPATAAPAEPLTAPPATQASPPQAVQPAAATARQEPQPQEEAVEPPRFNANYLDNPSPAYPALSRKLGEQGRVLLRVLVDAGGQPSQVVLHRSSRHARLDEIAVESVRHWKFVPARQAGHPVAAWVIVPIQFSLRG